MSDLSALQAILAGLTSTDNAHRSQAEQALNQAIDQSPAGVLAALAQLGTTSADPALRQFALVLLRTLSLKSPPASLGSKSSSLVNALSNPHLNLVRAPLLTAFPTESDAAVRAKLASAVAGLAQAALDEKHLWAELGPVLLAMTRDSRADVRESVMRVWEDCPALVKEEDPNGVKGVFSAAFQDPESVEVRLAAFKGAIAFLCDASAALRKSSDDFVASMLNVIPSLPAVPQCQALLSLTTLSSSYPDLFKPHLESFLPFLISLSHPPPLSSPAELEELGIDLDAPAQAALEILLELADSKPAPLRRLVLPTGESFIKSAGRVCLELIGRLSDDLDDWAGRDSWEDEEDAEDEEEEWSRFGEEGLDRLAQGLGGKTVLPEVWPDVKGLLEGESWKGKYAGLMAIASIAEGVAPQMEAQLGVVLGMIATLVNDEHPRVRYALVHCLGQLCTDFDYILPQTYIDQVLPILLHTLTHPVPRVQAHSARALVNFCDGLSSTSGLGSPYLEQIVQSLVALLQNDSTQEGVKAQIVTSLATVANAAGEAFGRFYGELMPVLVGVLERGIDEPVVPGPEGEEGLSVEERRKRLMKGKVLECCGLMGLAVGPDMFKTDAIKLAELMVRMQNGVIGEDDPQVSYLLLSWGKICEALKEDFAPYLPIVMPDLLKSASLTPDISFVDDDEEETKDGWDSIVDIGGNNVGIKTSSIEQTANAFQLLVVYTSTLSGLFKPYMEETLQLSLKNLTFFFDDSVRESASIIIPLLMKTAKDQGMITESLVKEVFDQLLTAIAAEADAAILSYFLKSVSDCIRVIGPANFPSSAREVLEKAAQTQAIDIADRRKLRAERSQEWDEEDREEAYELEREETIALDQMAHALLQVDPSHPLLVTISSVKELGMAPEQEWEDDEE